jgi:radical SAM superfamily enzyme YgiQ (UPF0313 family)
MKYKIVLYNPQSVFFTMPLALLAVGSCLDKSRFDVCIIDARLESDPLARVLHETKDALCLGVTVLTGAPIRDALHVTRAAKRQKPDLVTIWGGWHPSLFPIDTLLAEPNIDISVQGQGEATFTELVEHLAAGESISEIRGICHRNGETPYLNPSRPLQDMDAFARPNYDLIPISQYYTLKGKRQLDYITSTGCPFRCAFCADPFVYGRKYKAVSPARLVDHLHHLWIKYPFDDLNFQDETFFTHQRRVAEIAEEILKRDMKFSWAATMRADQGSRLPEEVFALCKRSGLRRVLIGVESGSPATIKKIMKDTSLDQVIESAEMCLRYDVAVIFSFIVGFPYETEAEVNATLNLMKKLRAMSPKFETPLFYYKPYPGSSITLETKYKLPKTLEEWANFDYVGGETGPWVSTELYRKIERFKFYLRTAWGMHSQRRWPLKTLARWRCNHDLYAMPLEKYIMDWIDPPLQLS